MNSDTCQVLELQNEIPFKKIQKLLIKNVSWQNQEYQISLDLKYEWRPPQKSYSIKRNHDDFIWILERIAEQNPLVFILPIFMDSRQSFITVFAEKLLENYQTQQQRVSHEEFRIRSIKRFLNVIEKVSMPSIYWIQTFNQTSLFIFFHEDFQLYKLQPYQRKRSTSEQQNSFSLGLINSSLVRGSKIIRQFLGFSNNTSETYLQQEMKMFQKLESSVNILVGEILNVYRNLNALKLNFLAQSKRIAAKQLEIYKLLLKLENIDKLEVTQKCKKIKQKLSEDQFEHDLKLYKCYLHKQEQQLEQEINTLKLQSFQKVFSHKIQLEITDITHQS